MGHIHEAPGQHDSTVGSYVFRTDFDQPKLLLHWHKKLNKWLQFGGHVELHETPWQAAEHELLEESGYEFSQLKLLQPAQRMQKVTGAVLHPQPVNINTHPFNDTHFHTVVEYVFVTSEEPKHKIAQGESDTFILLTRDELAALDTAEIYEGTRDIGIYMFDECLPTWEEVDPHGFVL